MASELERDGKPAWYVAHTYSGYENKVKLDIEQTIKNRALEDYIFEVRVPTQVVAELNKDGKEKKTEKKLFPGYVLVNMIMTNDTWYVIRNTRGVTGFVGPDSKPVPISPEEIAALEGRSKEVHVTFEVGDKVIVTQGSLKDNTAKVIDVNDAKKRLTIGVQFMGSERKVELSFADVKKV